MNHKLVLSSLILLSLAGCKPGSKSKEPAVVKEVVEVDTVAVAERVEPEIKIQEKKEEPAWAPKIHEYNPSRTRYNDLVHTKLQVSFDWTKAYLNGKANLTLKPMFYPTDSLSLDAQGLDIKKVALVQGGNMKDLQYKYDGQEMKIQLGQTYTRDQQYEIYIEYTAKPNELKVEGSEAITDAKGLYFINPDGKDPNKPKQIWTQGETQSSSAWFPTIDSPNERTTQEMFITVEDKYVTLSNGKLITSKKNNDGTRTDYWKMSLGHAPYLFMMAIGEFAVVKDKWRNMEVNYYVEKEYEKYAKLIFGNTPQMLEFFSKRMGVDYPWEKYSQVVVRDFVSGAMENTTGTIHFGALQHDDRAHLDSPYEDIIAHELFHHWFGDLVTCESWANLPLNESFATYGEYLWNEHKYGKFQADEHIDGDLSTYLAESQQKREPLIRYYFKNREEMFDGHSYQKGGRVLHMLRNIIGDDAFFAGLKLYLTRNAYTDVEIAELRMAFEDVTGQDLFWFFDQWFMKPGHVELLVEYNTSTAGQVEVKIAQKQDLNYMPVYKLPTKIEVQTSAGNKVYPVTINSVDTSFTFNYSGDLQNVIFDTDKVLLTKIKDKKSKKFWLHQLTNGTNYKQIETASTGLAMYLDDEEVFNGFVKLLDHPYHGIREIAVEQLGQSSLMDKAADKMKIMAQKDPKASVRAASVEFLASALDGIPEDKRGDVMQSYLDVFQKAMKDSSYQVTGSGLEAFYKFKPKDAVSKANELKTLKSAKIQSTICNIFMEEDDANAANFVMENFAKMEDSFDKFNLIQKFAGYVAGKEDPIKSKGLDFLKDQAKNNGTWWIRYAAARGLMTSFNSDESVKKFLKELKETETNGQLKKIYEQQL